MRNYWLNELNSSLKDPTIIAANLSTKLLSVSELRCKFFHIYVHTTAANIIKLPISVIRLLLLVFNVLDQFLQLGHMKKLRFPNIPEKRYSCHFQG